MTEQEIREVLEELAPVIEQARAAKDQVRLEECQEILDLLEQQLLPKKKEIVFLPYKASMWDSLESIWQAARADAACHAVVIPIPYAERNADGSCGEWHCESEDFPADVPVVDWRTYSISEHHPDVIYIHNPYDDSNRLTMVEPRFFSRNLRLHTDMLVYVPYFAWSGYWPENHLNLPCYTEVDKIIVQKEGYQVVSKDWLEADGVSLAEAMPAGKLAALGSPKLDRIWWCEEHKEVPAEWAGKVAGRKVVMYNTSVAPVMCYGRRSLAKMHQVIHAFARHPELVLLWRPHPLLETMLQSQRPDLLYDYRETVAAFQQLPNGIYDTTPDVDRSVALADAYVGEGSSVVQLFAVLGKPIYYTDLLTGEPAAGDQRQLSSIAMHCTDDTLYFWAEYLNALCRLQVQTGQVEILCRLPMAPYIIENFGSLVKVDSHLILTPLDASYIADYDLQTGQLKQVPYSMPLHNGNFHYAEVYAGKVYMIGNRYPAIMIYSVRQGTVSYQKACFDEILSDRSGRHEEMLGKPYRTGDILYIPVLQSNRVLEYRLMDDSWTLHFVGPAEAGYGYVTAFEDAIWLAPWMGGPIARWVPATGEISLYDQFPHDFSTETMPGSDEAMFFSDAVHIGHYWWLMPFLSNQVLRVDLRNGRIESMPLGIDLGTRRSAYFQQLRNVWCAEVWKDRLAIWCGYDRNIRIVNSDTGEVEAVWPVLLSVADLQTCHQQLLRQEDFGWIPWEGVYAAVDDGLHCTVDKFCAYVAADRHDRKAQRQLFKPLAENADGTCGAHIHSYILQCLSEKQEHEHETK